MCGESLLRWSVSGFRSGIGALQIAVQIAGAAEAGLELIGIHGNAADVGSDAQRSVGEIVCVAGNRGNVVERPATFIIGKEEDRIVP